MENKLSVLCAFVCNPYLAVFFKDNYEKYWKDEIGEMLINVNGLNDDVREFIQSIWQTEKVAHINNERQEMRQGYAFDNVYPFAKGDVVMTIDTDNFILKKGVINGFYQKIMSGEVDAIGSRGDHAYPGWVADELVIKYGRVRFNPFMSFFRKNILDKIENLSFQNYGFKAGEKFDFIDFVPKNNGWLDIMGKLSLEVFSQTEKLMVIPSSQRGEYVHFGALSSVYRRNFRSLENENEQVYANSFNEGQPKFYLILYYLIYEMTKDRVPLVKHNLEYEKGYLNEISKTGINLKTVREEANKLIDKYPELFK